MMNGIKTIGIDYCWCKIIYILINKNCALFIVGTYIETIDYYYILL